jgi:hypothetical protein
MQKSQDRTYANLEVILEETCKEFPHGGDHSMRKKIARKLLQSVQQGNRTFSDLSAVARTMLSELTKRP